METQTSSLELLAGKTLERVTTLEVDLAVIKSNYATKEDVARIKEDIAKSEVTLLKWFIGTAVTLTGLAFAAARFIT